jgi:LPXTG-motif cell wall-anchored protein
MKIAKILVCASTFVLLSAAPSFAMGEVPGGGGSGTTTRSAPGPMIGVGLPALVALGGYVWYRRRQRRK